MTDKAKAAIATLENLGYTHEGGILWKPPLGKSPDFNMLDCLRARADSLEDQLIAQANRAVIAEQQVTALTQRLDMANRLNTEARNQLAQLSARQAAPDGWRLVPVEPDSNMKRAAQKALMDHSSHSEWLEEEWPDGLRMWNGMLSAAPPPPEREPLTDEQIEAAYKNLQVRRKKDQDEAFQAGIGKICMHCSEGHYQADWNGYSTFHRCDKCRHVPFDLSGLVKKSAASCWCETCRPATLSDMRFIVCPDCGNKRCPKATHHDNACTNSNAPGQPGSSWEHVKPHGSHQ
ncbi:hypothetical protein [Comamonas sp. JUb58]|uniref:hypothetical protein n=1 Tax=Comamonas sp. JUb58 TaxID=2485114 RepID=UPI0010E44BB2|nr:hypothetical protein [Comamonas sp. JUb58]TDS84141.1 hypothetical protein EDF71_103268 [Comamonas sp. JUb58]